MLPAKDGIWVHVALESPSGKEHSVFLYDAGFQDPGWSPDEMLAHWRDKNTEYAGLLLRIHSSCRFGDVFGGLSCDCGAQLHAARGLIVMEGRGAVLYLDQEGRDIGLVLKNEAVHLEQTRGLKTSETFAHLGMKHQDLREYDSAVFMLENILSYPRGGCLKLMTNNPLKIETLSSYGYDVRRQPIWVETTGYAMDYIHSKREDMGHIE